MIPTRSYFFAAKKSVVKQISDFLSVGVHHIFGVFKIFSYTLYVVFDVLGAAAILASYFGATRVSCGSTTPFICISRSLAIFDCGKQRTISPRKNPLRATKFASGKPA
jgi:hypothetical protein